MSTGNQNPWTSGRGAVNGMLGLGALFLGPIAAALAGREAAQTFFGLGIVLMVLCSVLAVIGQVFGLMR